MPFQRKALAAEIAALEDLLEKVGAEQTIENFLLMDFDSGPSIRSAIQTAAFRFGDVGTRAGVPQ